MIAGCVQRTSPPLALFFEQLHMCQEGTGYGHCLTALCCSIPPGSPQASPTPGRGLWPQPCEPCRCSTAAAEGPAAPGGTQESWCAQL